MNDAVLTVFDVVGVGANSVDYVYSLPAFPNPDTAAAKLRITHHSVMCGGQTATALSTCAAMGLRTKYVGTTGSDENGERIRGELARRGVNIEHVDVRRTSNAFAVILIDDRRGERVVLWHRNAALALQPGELDASVLGPSRLIHVDDADEDAAIRAAALGRSAGIPVTSDIERLTERTEPLVCAVTIPIFGEHVLEQLTGERDFERALRKVQRLRRQVRLKPDITYGHEVRLKPDTTYGDEVRLKPDATHEGDMLCVTLGARGAMLLDGDRLHVAPGHDVEVVDTTGAGDVFRGAFITALLRGDSPSDILRFANAAAAISCTRRGAIDSVPTIQETMALAHSDRSAQA